jgi:hypothetical protein
MPSWNLVRRDFESDGRMILKFRIAYIDLLVLYEWRFSTHKYKVQGCAAKNHILAINLFNGQTLLFMAE